MSHQQTTERPPDAETVRQWYEEGWIDDNGLDELLETAIETYGGDGEREVPGIEVGESGEAAWLRSEHDLQNPTETDTVDVGGAIVFVGIPIGVLLAVAVIAAFPGLLEALFGWEIVTGQHPIPPI